jgi:AcrR family transcriptional regulator
MLTGHARRLKGLRMISAMPPQPAPSPPRQRAALLNARSRETRRALVRAALRLWGQGDFDVAYEASTVADIARAAGVSRGTFYFHFAGKEDILLEMSSATVQAMIDQIQAGMRRGIALHPLTGHLMASMARRVARGPRAAALRAGALGFQGRAGEVTLTGSRLGTAFEILVRYGKETGELSASADEEEAAAMLTAVTMEAIIRWGSGNRPASWLRKALQDRAEVILNGMNP